MNTVCDAYIHGQDRVMHICGDAFQHNPLDWKQSGKPSEVRRVVEVVMTQSIMKHS
jgi:hypothetical protein